MYSFIQVLITEIRTGAAREKDKNTKEENLKPKDSEQYLHIQNYLLTIPRISYSVED